MCFVRALARFGCLTKFCEEQINQPRQSTTTTMGRGNGNKKSQGKPPAKAGKQGKKPASDWGTKENCVLEAAKKAGKIKADTTVASLKKNFPLFEEHCWSQFHYQVCQNKLRKAKSEMEKPEGKCCCSMIRALVFVSSHIFHFFFYDVNSR